MGNLTKINLGFGIQNKKLDNLKKEDKEIIVGNKLILAGLEINLHFNKSHIQRPIL